MGLSTLVLMHKELICDIHHETIFMVHVCIYTCTCTYNMHTYIHAYIHTYIHTYMITYIHVHAYTVHTYIHTYIYIHAYIHTCIHTYIHTYIHTLYRYCTAVQFCTSCCKFKVVCLKGWQYQNLKATSSVLPL